LKRWKSAEREFVNEQKKNSGLVELGERGGGLLGKRGMYDSDKPQKERGENWRTDRVQRRGKKKWTLLKEIPLMREITRDQRETRRELSSPRATPIGIRKPAPMRENLGARGGEQSNSQKT